MSNLKQIGLALMQYTQDYDERLPANSYLSTKPFPNDPSHSGSRWLWWHMIYPYIKNSQVFICPSTTASWDTLNPDGYAPVTKGTSGLGTMHIWSYGYNQNLVEYSSGVSTGRSLADIPQVAITPFSADSTYYLMSADVRCAFRHDATTNPSCTGTVGTNNDPPMPRHLDTFNMLFVDGHVKSQRSNDWVTTASRSPNDRIWQKWDPDYQP